MDWNGILTGAVGGAGNIVATAMANSANRKLAEYSFDQQKQMIAEQNAYNSPLEQMKRYEEAGLNPNLIYGSGQASAGNQQGIAKYEAPTMQKADIGPAIAQAMQAIMMKKDLELRQAEIELKKQEHENLKEQQFKIRADRHATDINNMWNSVLYGFNPGLVSSPEDEAKVKSSMGFKRYDAQLMSETALYEYRQAQKSYLEVQKQVAGLTAEQKRFYNDNIQPLMQEILSKKSKGLDFSNELLKLQSEFYKADKFVGYGTGILNAISNFIKPFHFGGGSNPSPAPYIQPSTDW